MNRLGVATLLVVFALALGAPATTVGSGEGETSDAMIWTRLGRPFGGGHVNDVAALPDGTMLAVGSVGETSARVWHSADGVGWQEIPLPGRDHTWVRHVAVAEDDIVAVGVRSGPEQRQPETVVWSSHDGLEWSERRTLDRGVPVAALATEDGYAVVTTGSAPHWSRPITVWHSTDGVDWRSFEVTDPDARIAAVAAERTAAGSWVIAGMDRNGAAWLWRSDDGLAWEPISEPTTRGWRMGRLEGGPTGFLFFPATGNGESVAPETWHSADGRAWTESTTLEASIMAMSAGPTGIVALTTPLDRHAGKRDYPVSLQRSKDGRSWSATEVPEFQGKPFQRIAMMPDGQVLAIRRLNDITWLGRPSDAPAVVLPEPTPNARGELLDFKALVKSGDHPEGEFTEVAADIVDYFERAGDDLDPLHLASPPIDDLAQDCERVTRNRRDRLECVPVFLRLYQAHGLSRDPLPYELADRWLGVTMKGADVRPYREHLLERMRWVRVAHPDWLKD